MKATGDGKVCIYLDCTESVLENRIDLHMQCCLKRLSVSNGGERISAARRER